MASPPPATINQRRPGPRRSPPERSTTPLRSEQPPNRPNNESAPGARRNYLDSLLLIGVIFHYPQRVTNARDLSLCLLRAYRGAKGTSFIKHKHLHHPKAT